MRVIISGGGTAGHIYPGLALAGSLRSTEAALEILFVGTKSGLESKLVAEANYHFEPVEVHGFTRKLSFDFFKALFLLLIGIPKSLRIINGFKPDVVIGLGGYVSVPVAVAASLKRIPLLLHEQNTVPGLANRLLTKRADMIAISFAASQKYFGNARRVELTGNPVRKEIIGSDLKDYNKFDLDAARKTILIFGGSRGAQRINEAMIEAYPLFRDSGNLQIIHSTGTANFEYVAAAIEKEQDPSDKIIYRCYPYLNQIDQAYSVSDLVVCRAGATTLAEVTALGKPAVFVPYPYATEDHQKRNAEVLRDAGAASIIFNEELDGNSLFGETTKIVSDDLLLKKMSEAAHSLGRPNAADALAKLVIELARCRK